MKTYEVISQLYFFIYFKFPYYNTSQPIKQNYLNNHSYIYFKIKFDMYVYTCHNGVEGKLS